MSAPAEIQVTYASWRVGDGDPVRAVGDRYSVTLEVKPGDGGTADDWHPRLAPSNAPTTGLWPLAGEPGGRHRLVGDVTHTYLGGVTFTDGSVSDTWSGITAGPWRLASPGRYVGRVSGEVVINDDSYMVDVPAVRKFATQEVEIAAIHYVEGRWGPALSGRGPWAFLGWEPPTAVARTDVYGPAVDGVFLLTCRLPLSGSSDPAT